MVFKVGRFLLRLHILLKCGVRKEDELALIQLLNQVLIRCPSLQLATYNIRVNTVHPDCVYDTKVWTNRILRSRAKQYGMSIDDYKKRNLLKTDVFSKDVANIVCFLAGNDRII